KRVPKANGSRRRDWARAWTTGGTSELVTIASLGDFDSRKQLLDDLIGCEAFHVGFGLKQDAMPEDGKSCGLYIIGEKILTSVHGGQGASDKEESNGRARTGAERDSRPIACAPDQSDNIRVQRGPDSHAFYLRACREKH